MNLIRHAIDRPIAVIAAVLMVVMFGLVALRTIPIQLSPDVDRPVDVRCKLDRNGSQCHQAEHDHHEHRRDHSDRPIDGMPD